MKGQVGTKRTFREGEKETWPTPFEETYGDWQWKTETEVTKALDTNLKKLNGKLTVYSTYTA